MEKNEIILSKMRKLKSFYGTYRSKARRNLRLYEYSPTLSLDNLTDQECVGYYNRNTFEIESDTTSSIQENIIRSCIDTLCSKIASQKVRPYINTQGASFNEMRIAKQAQDYFDIYFDEQNVNKTVTMAFRDACVFDKGVIYVNNEEKKIERIMPWQVYIDPREASYGRITQLAWERNQYPVSLIKEKFTIEREKLDRLDTVTYWEYWDIVDHKKAYYIPELDLYKEEKVRYNIIPFLFINYSECVKATTSQSVVDLLFGIQMEIDAILTKIKDASQITPIQTFFVPEGSNIRADMLTNRTGQIIQYTVTPNMTGSPITSSSTPFMDPQWMATVETLKQHAYELVGISQLSATSQKPRGLNSGVALSTMEDIESDRFETQLNSIIRGYVDLSKIIMDVFDPEEDILPPNKMRKQIKWKDIVGLRDRMQVQFSAAESLSKDPSAKLSQLQALYAAGLIPQSRIVQLMDLPDLQLGYSISNNSINAVLEVIDNCIENDVYDIPDYIPQQMLLEEILNTALSLKGSGNIENEASIQKLLKLYDIAQAKNIDAQTSAEMAATQTITNDIAEDMQNPNGMINSSIQGAMDNADNQFDVDQEILDDLNGENNILQTGEQ